MQVKKELFDDIDDIKFLDEENRITSESAEILRLQFENKLLENANKNLENLAYEVKKLNQEIFNLKYNRQVENKAKEQKYNSYINGTIFNLFNHDFIVKKDENISYAPQVAGDKMEAFFEYICEIVTSGLKKGIFIITSAYEFEPEYNQRPIAIAKEASAAGYFVIFLAWQWSNTEKLKKSGTVFGGSILQANRFDLHKLFNTLAKYKNSIDGHYVVTIPSEDIVNYIPKFQSIEFNTIYDNMDDWEEFNKVGQAVWWKDELETRALKESDRCIAISPTLKEKFSDLRHDVLCIPNGLRTVFRSEKFISSRAKRVDGKIVIGYFGHLTDAWFDWEGLIALADSNTKIIIEIIGYGEPDWVREKISHLENIRLIGFVPAEKLHQYMPEWHIGVIPFLNTALTKAVDPIKIYEYLYYGLPVIASGMEHLKSYPETKVISSWANASGIIENIYTQIVSGEIDYSAISDFCEHSRWRNRFEAMVG